LPEANYSEAESVRLLWYTNLRYKTAPVLLGHLPIQGEAEAGQDNLEEGTEMTNEYQIGDIIQLGSTIVRIDRIDGDRAWHHGTQLGEASYGGLAKGWCSRVGNWPILRRAGKSVSPDAEEMYQRAVRLFPDEPWLRASIHPSRQRKEHP
jgi:hypothetical protein